MSTIEKAVDKLNAFTKAEKKTEDAALSPSSLPDIDDFIDETVSSDADLNLHQPGEKLNTATFSVKIPWTKFAGMGMVSRDAPRSQVAEEFRIIKRPLIMNISGKNAVDVEHPNLIMVTSCMQGEGKTFTAINLAISMSMEKEKNVLFVDGDISKATAGTLLGVPQDRPGLIDLLEHDDLSVQDVLLHTSVPNLSIIPAGHIHQQSTELLASQQMLFLAQELSERYQDRIVIFDSPPLLMTTEARVLANAMGQIVFVVAAEQTAKEALNEALGYLSGDKVVGMVLNKAKRNLWNMDRYGYGYGYGYGSRSASKEVEA